MLSFFVLVITGFMLAYPGTWWSQALAQAGMTGKASAMFDKASAAADDVSDYGFQTEVRQKIDRYRGGL